MKPQQTTISGYVLLVMALVLWYLNENTLDKIGLLFLIGLVMIGYSVSYKIHKDFNNFKVVSLFGIPLWKQKLKVLYPDYISLFSGSFKKGNEWGAVAALGAESKSQSVVIKFFKGRKNEIVFRSNNYSMAHGKATELSTLLNVQVHDAIKNSST